MNDKNIEAIIADVNSVLKDIVEKDSFDSLAVEIHYQGRKIKAHDIGFDESGAQYFLELNTDKKYKKLNGGEVIQLKEDETEHYVYTIQEIEIPDLGEL